MHAAQRHGRDVWAGILPVSLFAMLRHRLPTNVFVAIVQLAASLAVLLVILPLAIVLVTLGYELALAMPAAAG